MLSESYARPVSVVSGLVFEQFRGLNDVGEEEPPQRVRCVQLTLASGGVFDVYRATEVNPSLPVWSVRGFEVAEDAPDVERRGLVMGTKDGRAMLTGGGRLDAQSAARSEMVTQSSVSSREVKDLSEVIAAAIKTLMDAE